jgi:tRNA threonylcarbamoyladenosine modification (KEOPS) complex Cgi121 subunit
MELLLRLICSNQVDKALDIGGIKNNGNGIGCFILLSENRPLIINAIKYMRKMFVKQNLSLLNATREKMTDICSRMDLTRSNYNKGEFLKILTEKAALVSQ